MKKLLACTVAAIMAASMMTACGDSSSDSKADKTTTTKAEETTTTAAESEAEESAAEESAADSAAESGAESGADESAADGEVTTDFKPLSAIKDELLNIDNASLTFKEDTDFFDWAYMFNQPVNGVRPGEEGYKGDEAVLDLSIQEVAGVNMLKVEQIQYPNSIGLLENKGVKLAFDMNRLFKGHEDELEKIFTVKADIVTIARDPAVFDEENMGGIGVYWYGGAFGTNNDAVWNGNMLEYSMTSAMNADEDGPEWINQWAYSELMIRPGIQSAEKKATFSKDFKTNYLTLMAWIVNSKIDLYVADIVFEDADGNIIKVPEENIKGGATYEKEELTDATTDGLVPRDEAGNVTYDESVIKHPPVLGENGVEIPKQPEHPEF